jgi:hypothetical protein
MKIKPTLPSLLVLLALAVVFGCGQALAQQTTAFTYQGQLRDGGTNANGTYTMTFKLYDALNGGGQIGSSITTSTTLANGLFSVNLDFGAGAFNGTGRWLDITAQSGTDAPETLTPRVQVLPAPYALFAAVAATVTNGAIMNAQLAGNAVNTTNIQNNAITTMQIAAGAVTTAQIANGVVTDAKIDSVSGSKVSGAVASATFATSAGSATTAGSATIAGTATLANSVAADSIATASLQDGAVTAAKIASGQVVKSLNGLTDFVTLASAGVPNIQVFISSGTFVVPTNVTKIMVEMWGGGGGGGAYGCQNVTNCNPGGGGGSGGYAFNVFNVTPGASYTVTTGSGGSGGIGGGGGGISGGTTTFGGLMSAGGGSGGSNGGFNPGSGGAGGIVNGSLINALKGGDGIDGGIIGGSGGAAWRGGGSTGNGPANGGSGGSPGSSGGPGKLGFAIVYY